MPKLWTEAELTTVGTEASTASAAERRRLVAYLADNPPDNLSSQAVQAAYRRAVQYVGGLPMAL